jgi:long-subunit acyl-CoA synthetase (AMP-forming)
MRELFNALRSHGEHRGDAVAFDDGATRLGYAALARRVAGAAEDLLATTASPTVVGILGSNQIDTIVAQLAAWYAGKTVVPLPPFFRLPQLRHLIDDAGIAHIVATPEMAGIARALDVPVTIVSQREAVLEPVPESAVRQIIYTSGSTGLPKGVVLTGEQMLWTVSALMRATEASRDDVYFSILPLALLLETLSAVVLPIMVGARVYLEPALTARFDNADGEAIADAIARRRPSCLVLVPQLLARWLTALEERAETPPDSLRFVAVGGSAVSSALAQCAWDRGIPVYEGYGLSECASVVALNRPGDRKPGSVGRPLPGIKIAIEDGEIVVSGPSVMERYLRGRATQGRWRTGDLGEIDADGVLTVRGRADNRIVTSIGRNISPEWIETLLLADSRIGHCILTDIGDRLTAILVPTAGAEPWFAAASSEATARLVAERCRDVPRYAVPQRFAILSHGELARFGLFTANGRIRRKQLRETYAALVRSGEVVPADIETSIAT